MSEEGFRRLSYLRSSLTSVKLLVEAAEWADVYLPADTKLFHVLLHSTKMSEYRMRLV